MLFQYFQICKSKKPWSKVKKHKYFLVEYDPETSKIRSIRRGTSTYIKTQKRLRQKTVRTNVRKNYPFSDISTMTEWDVPHTEKVLKPFAVKPLKELDSKGPHFKFDLSLCKGSAAQQMSASKLSETEEPDKPEKPEKPQTPEKPPPPPPDDLALLLQDPLIKALLKIFSMSRAQMINMTIDLLYYARKFFATDKNISDMNERLRRLRNRFMEAVRFNRNEYVQYVPAGQSHTLEQDFLAGNLTITDRRVFARSRDISGGMLRNVWRILNENQANAPQYILHIDIVYAEYLADGGVRATLVWYGGGSGFGGPIETSRRQFDSVASFDTWISGQNEGPGTEAIEIKDATVGTVQDMLDWVSAPLQQRNWDGRRYRLIQHNCIAFAEDIVENHFQASTVELRRFQARHQLGVQWIDNHQHVGGILYDALLNLRYQRRREAPPPPSQDGIRRFRDRNEMVPDQRPPATWRQRWRSSFTELLNVVEAVLRIRDVNTNMQNDMLLFEQVERMQFVNYVNCFNALVTIHNNHAPRTQLTLIDPNTSRAERMVRRMQQQIEEMSRSTFSNDADSDDSTVPNASTSAGSDVSTVPNEPAPLSITGSVTDSDLSELEDSRSWTGSDISQYSQDSWASSFDEDIKEVVDKAINESFQGDDEEQLQKLLLGSSRLERHLAQRELLNVRDYMSNPFLRGLAISGTRIERAVFADAYRSNNGYNVTGILTWIMSHRSDLQEIQIEFGESFPPLISEIMRWFDQKEQTNVENGKQGLPNSVNKNMYKEMKDSSERKINRELLRQALQRPVLEYLYIRHQRAKREERGESKMFSQDLSNVSFLPSSLRRPPPPPPPRNGQQSTSFISSDELIGEDSNGTDSSGMRSVEDIKGENLNETDSSGMRSVEDIKGEDVNNTDSSGMRSEEDVKEENINEQKARVRDLIENKFQEGKYTLEDLQQVSSNDFARRVLEAIAEMGIEDPTLFSENGLVQNEMEAFIREQFKGSDIPTSNIEDILTIYQQIVNEYVPKGNKPEPDVPADDGPSGIADNPASNVNDEGITEDQDMLDGGAGDVGDSGLQQDVGLEEDIGTGLGEDAAAGGEVTLGGGFNMAEYLPSAAEAMGMMLEFGATMVVQVIADEVDILIEGRRNQPFIIDTSELKIQDGQLVYPVPSPGVFEWVDLGSAAGKSLQEWRAFYTNRWASVSQVEHDSWQQDVVMERSWHITTSTMIPSNHFTQWDLEDGTVLIHSQTGKKRYEIDPTWANWMLQNNVIATREIMWTLDANNRLVPAHSEYGLYLYRDASTVGLIPLSIKPREDGSGYYSVNGRYQEDDMVLFTRNEELVNTGRTVNVETTWEHEYIGEGEQAINMIHQSLYPTTDQESDQKNTGSPGATRYDESGLIVDDIPHEPSPEDPQATPGIPSHDYNRTEIAQSHVSGSTRLELQLRPMFKKAYKTDQFKHYTNRVIRPRDKLGRFKRSRDAMEAAKFNYVPAGYGEQLISNEMGRNMIENEAHRDYQRRYTQSFFRTADMVEPVGSNLIYRSGEFFGRSQPFKRQKRVTDSFIFPLQPQSSVSDLILQPLTQANPFFDEYEGSARHMLSQAHQSRVLLTQFDNNVMRSRKYYKRK